MTENTVPDPWSVNATENNIGTPINIDDGGGLGFKSGYDTANTFTLKSAPISIPQTVGYWKMNENFHVHVRKRPNRLNRLMTKFLLGWEWMDT